ncbi:hypothetical protein MHYP_G00127960 [Metynnis hypsauchen]
MHSVKSKVPSPAVLARSMKSGWWEYKHQVKLYPILKTLPKAKTMTRAFHKHSIDRNTVVSTSVIGEHTTAVPEVYEEVLAKKPCGETVLAFAKRCEAAIQGDEDVKEKIESMKVGDTLLPIRGSKPV